VKIANGFVRSAGTFFAKNVVQMDAPNVAESDWNRMTERNKSLTTMRGDELVRIAVRERDMEN